MATLGNVGASALVKSAAGIATQIADYNDKVQAIEWGNSSQDDAAFSVYSKYLTDRIAKLQGTGSLSDASKALTMSSTLTSANRSYVSNAIQNTSMNILEGNSTATDKQTQIVSLYQQAVANGDDNLAQNLRSQCDTLNQQIQYDHQTASTAYAANLKADQEAQKQGDEDAITGIKNSLSNLSFILKSGGQTAISEEGKQYVDSIRAYAKTMGIDIPEGSSVTNGGLITAAINAIGQLTANEADILTAMPGQSVAAQVATQDVQSIINGQTQFSVGGTSFNYKTAQEYAQNPNQYYAETTGHDINGNPVQKLTAKAIEGFQYDNTGALQPIYAATKVTSASSDKNKMAQANTDLTQAGFTILGMNPDGTLNVQATANSSNNYFQTALKKYGLSANGNFDVYVTDKGYQLKTPITSAGNNQLLTIAKDNSGKFGIFSSTATPGSSVAKLNSIAGQYGFNQSQNSLVSPATIKTIAPTPIVTAPLNAKTTVAPTMQKTLSTGVPLAPTALPKAQPVQQYSANGKYSNYIGNNDWRGYLNYLSKNGNAAAGIALQYVGNDNRYGGAPASALSALSQFGSVKAPSSGGGGGGGGGGGF
jgi:superoxide dismutase